MLYFCKILYNSNENNHLNAQFFTIAYIGNVCHTVYDIV